jgi:hypothetical protein
MPLPLGGRVLPSAPLPARPSGCGCCSSVSDAPGAMTPVARPLPSCRLTATPSALLSWALPVQVQCNPFVRMCRPRHGHTALDPKHAHQHKAGVKAMRACIGACRGAAGAIAGAHVAPKVLLPECHFAAQVVHCRIQRLQLGWLRIRGQQPCPAGHGSRPAVHVALLLPLLCTRPLAPLGCAL